MNLFETVKLKLKKTRLTRTRDGFGCEVQTKAYSHGSLGSVHHITLSCPNEDKEQSCTSLPK